MKCSNCNREIGKDVYFCPYCMEKVPRKNEKEISLLKKKIQTTKTMISNYKRLTDGTLGRDVYIYRDETVSESVPQQPTVSKNDETELSSFSAAAFLLSVAAAIFTFCPILGADYSEISWLIEQITGRDTAGVISCLRVAGKLLSTNMSGTGMILGLLAMLILGTVIFHCVFWYAYFVKQDGEYARKALYYGGIYGTVVSILWIVSIMLLNAYLSSESSSYFGIRIRVFVSEWGSWGILGTSVGILLWAMSKKGAQSTVQPGTSAKPATPVSLDAVIQERRCLPVMNYDPVLPLRIYEVDMNYPNKSDVTIRLRSYENEKLIRLDVNIWLLKESGEKIVLPWRIFTDFVSENTDTGMIEVKAKFLVYQPDLTDVTAAMVYVGNYRTDNMCINGSGCYCRVEEPLEEIKQLREKYGQDFVMSPKQTEQESFCVCGQVYGKGETCPMCGRKTHPAA